MRLPSAIPTMTAVLAAALFLSMAVDADAHRLRHLHHHHKPTAKAPPVVIGNWRASKKSDCYHLAQPLTGPCSGTLWDSPASGGYVFSKEGPLYIP